MGLCCWQGWQGSHAGGYGVSTAQNPFPRHTLPSASLKLGKSNPNVSLFPHIPQRYNTHNMAETVGLVFGVASFVLQVNDTIKRLQNAREYIRSEAGDELESLVQRLEILRHMLLSLESVQASRMVNLAINSCQREYSSVDIALQRVSERLSNSSGKRLRVVRHSDRIKDELRGIGQKLDYVIQPLTWYVFSRPTRKVG